MIKLNINKVPTLFIKAFSGEDVETIIHFVRDARKFHRGDENTVLFIDTPITPATVESVEALRDEGFRVVFRDHHGIDGEPSNEREARVVAATAKLKRLLGEDCTITIRRLHPACSTLVSVGEFKDAIAIIADPDADGLTAAMKAAGISYDGLDEDAAKLDGEPQQQVSGTEISQLLAKGLAVIPSYDSAKPKEREIAHQKLFFDWVKAVGGDAAARKQLEERVALYDEAVSVARSLSESAVFVAPGVMLVDLVEKPLHDPGTLSAILESHPDCRVTVVRKSLGPIAALHGIQYSLAVAKTYQSSISLFDLVRSHAQSDPAQGIISNVSFLLHTSEDVWQTEVLPRLKEMKLTE